jgi:hypothetical protein
MQESTLCPKGVCMVNQTQPTIRQVQLKRDAATINSRGINTEKNKKIFVIFLCLFLYKKIMLLNNYLLLPFSTGFMSP